MVWGLVEITFGPVHASNSLPEWQAVKLTFFAPWSNLLTFTNTSKTWILFSHFCVFSTVNFWHPLLCTLQRYVKSPVHKKHVRRLTCLSLTVPVPLTLIKKIQIASNPSASWALRNLKFCLNTAWWGNLNKTSQIKVRHEYNIIIMRLCAWCSVQCICQVALRVQGIFVSHCYKYTARPSSDTKLFMSQT